MSLAQWLVATKSVRNVQDRPSPYRLRVENKLPKFGSVRKTEMENQKGVAALARRAPLDRKEPIMKNGRTAEGKGGAKLMRWVKRANPFAPKIAKPPPRVPVQAELILEGVKPVRNDLHDTDIVVLPARVTAAKMDAAPGHDSKATAGARKAGSQMLRN